MNIDWKSTGRESVKIQLQMDGNTMTLKGFQAIGGLPFLRFSQKMKAQLTGSIADLTPPKGKDTSSMVWREILLKIKGQWLFPVENVELCHCRKVSTAKVDEAIVYGAHDIVNIRKQTSANTGCATCLPDIQSLLNLRLEAKP